jgi:hypothetical protein
MADNYFRVERSSGRFRWFYRNKIDAVANSILQCGSRECKANLRDVVFWVTRKVKPFENDGNKFILAARGQRTSELHIVRFINGWNWRLWDGRKVYFQPALSDGLDAEFDAYEHFEKIRASFNELPAKISNSVVMT